MSQLYSNLPIWNIGGSKQDPVIELSELRNTLLARRGVLENEATKWLQVNYERDIHDPYLMPQMSVTVDRIKQAVVKQERILVYGDYDADGITATAIMVSALRRLGARVMPYLPHRQDDGYGLSLSVLEALWSEFDLLLTVDCGITNVEEVAWVKARGKDVIITDHHSLPSELPSALAILHPQIEYPFKHLCGAGVAWKLASALLSHSEEKWLLDLVCLGTVADIVPLVDENRAIVKFGQSVLERSRRPGIRALLGELANKGEDITTDDIGYRIVPLLNAAGRLEHAQPALDLLLTEKSDRADELLKKLRSLNRQRQIISSQIEIEAEEHLDRVDDPILFAVNRTWPAGVVGLVAGRLSRKYNRPAIVVGDGGRCAVGSARAPEGVNVLSIIAAGNEHLIKFGGHKSAAGFSIAYEGIELLKEVLLERG